MEPKDLEEIEEIEEIEEVEEVVEVQEVPDDSDARRGGGPRKNKRKKKRRRPSGERPVREEGESLVWPWWVFGGGGILVLVSFLFGMVMLADDFMARGFAVYLLVMIPISTGIFFFAMYLSSVLLGAVEIGEIHVAIFKSFYLVFLVNLVSLVPGGGYLTFFVWLAGLMVIFRLDFWEARMLIFINWVLNFGVRFVLLTAILSWAMHGGGRHEIDLPGSGGQPGQNAHWGPEEVQDLGGSVEFDPANADDEVVVGISFRNARIGDAALAHMKDFPRLLRLDLTNTAVTDAGLKQLKGCLGLQLLTLTGARVTNAGVQDLQQALPRLQIVR